MMNEKGHDVEAPLFIGKYIIIRHITPSDALLYHIWLQNPVFLAYKPYLKQLCPTAQQLSAYLTMQTELNPRIEFEVLVIQKRTQKPIGIMGLSSIDEFNKKAEFSAGFVSGYGTKSVWEAIHAGLSIIFNNDFHKLIFYVTSNNHQALKIMRTNGFISEGYFKEEILINENQRADLYRFALMRKVWDDQNHILHQRLNRIAPITL